MHPEDGGLRLPSLMATDFVSILNAIDDEVYITDSQGYTIFANRTCEQHYGVPVERLLGKHVLELQDEGIYWPAVTPLVLKTGKPVTIEQSTLIGRKLVITGIPIRDEAGAVKMVVCTSRDVTGLVRLQQHIQTQAELLEQAGRHPVPDDPLDGILCQSPQMGRAVALARIAARVNTTVLITGESGVGKDLLARAIHALSPRSGRPFLPVNCSAIAEPLLESELFGYAPGAFTGAAREGKPGLLVAAQKGTLFLDEIGDMPLSLQAKILQVIEDKQFFPVGSTRQLEVDVRIIAATNQDLEQAIAEGRFRDDLFYRLNVLSIHIPPLRHRRDDVLPLIYHYLNRSNAEHGCRRTLSGPALRCLLAYDWPGNVRELRNVVERLVLTVAGDQVEAEDIPESIRRTAKTLGLAHDPSLTLGEAKELLEAEMIREAYARLGSSYRVADALGISQSAATRKIRRHCAKARLKSG